MAGNFPGPMCSTRCGADYIDDGTLCLSRSEPPIPTKPPSSRPNPAAARALAEDVVRETICKVAKDQGLSNITDEGGVIKYRGRLYPCFWELNRHSRLFKESALAHEKQHIKDAEKFGYHVGGLVNWLVDKLGPGRWNPWMMRVKTSEKVAVLSEYLAYKQSVEVYESVEKRRPLTPQEASELAELKKRRDEYRHKFEAQ